MNKIRYPADINAFRENYYNTINRRDEMFIDHILFKLPVPYRYLTFKDLLVSSFEDTVVYAEIIEKYLIPLLSLSEKKMFIEKFNYDQNQSDIADFFMKYATEMDMKTCHYCNIEFINTFQDLGEYNNVLDFLNNGTKEELIIYIGEKTGEKIFDYREANLLTDINQLRSINGIGSSTIISISSLDLKIAKQKNHFTLDHFIPKGEFPYFALSLYNLVPSCYSCNSKFKKSKYYEIGDYLKSISPTSTYYNLIDNIEFKLYFNVSGVDIEERINNVVDLNDFMIRPEINNSMDNKSKKFLDIFKIRGRYRFHKYQSMKMIKDRQDYSDSSVGEISRITGRSISEIKKDIFGSIIYSSIYNNEPLAKYKLDIAKQIGIFP